MAYYFDHHYYFFDLFKLDKISFVNKITPDVIVDDFLFDRFDHFWFNNEINGKKFGYLVTYCKEKNQFLVINTLNGKRIRLFH